MICFFKKIQTAKYTEKKDKIIKKLTMIVAVLWIILLSILVVVLCI